MSTSPLEVSDTSRIATWMGPARCRQLLAASKVCRLAFIDDGRPQIVVLNHSVDGRDVILQTSDKTRLARLTASGDQISATIEVDSATAAMHSGWSIVASGQLARTAATAVTRAPTPWRDEAAGVLLRLTLDEIHGQVVGA